MLRKSQSDITGKFPLSTFLTAALAAVGAACASMSPSDTAGDALAEPIAPAVALASFDSLWSKVSQSYVDTAFVSSEWAAVRDSLRPRAERIATRKDLDALLAEALGHIPDSHFYLIPARVAVEEKAAATSDGRGRTGLFVRVAEGRVVAWRVEQGSPASAAGIASGQHVVKIGAKGADSAMRRVLALPQAAQPRALSEMLHGLNGILAPAVGDTIRVEVMSADGKSKAHSLVAVPGTGAVSQFGNLPPLPTKVDVVRVPSAAGRGCVGVVAFNIWLPELGPELERAVDSVRSCDGIVIDLRGNPGGVGAMVMGFGGYFVSSTQSLGTMRTRQVKLNFVINPRGSRPDGSTIPPFTGPVAIVMDPMSASTSEIFATGMQRIGRARVFGERSAGAALPALMERLPSGDVFVHAVADFTDPLGRRIEGAGAVPDEIVPLTVQDLKAGRDAPLEASMKWIMSQASSK